jgi:hypothetical protein
VSDDVQTVARGATDSGVQQSVELLAGQKYLLQARIKIGSGGVKLAIGPALGVEQKQVYQCGGGEWKLLQTTYTPSFSGSHNVKIVSSLSQSIYDLDDVSLTPTKLIAVDNGGPEQPCQQMAPWQ